ncbi:hypothetical protein [Exercitatus varius]|uniref:hypothetical protein n=1 Tax=Exercitatus varius TaxID=67857 RepID=UPI00294AEB72|nr:hypothetical protein [Exercitatus varius]MDG2942883.1 hypothetical protein [Exercitatus varius]MDG2962956.1 hypothetical protein [Exercitatus varius]
MGETVNKSKIAEQIGAKIFKSLFWEICPTTNINFSCLCPNPKEEIDKNKGKIYHNNQGTHPMDASFTYIDPYLGRKIYLNTDFKSYSRSSIKPSQIRNDLISLAETISCAQDSEQWANYVGCIDSIKEVRGLLFLYNSDYEYEHDINYILSKVYKDKEKAIPLEKNQYIHFLDPLTINRIYSMVKDLENLKKDLYDEYSFFYPNHRLSKNVISNTFNPPLPCTIEMACSSYTVIKYRKGDIEGFLIYYNEKGDTKEEFLYLFDYLTSVQIPFDVNLKIRATNANVSNSIVNNFLIAKKTYLQDWNFSNSIVESLKELEIEIIDQNTPNFIKTLQGWGELQ